MLIFYFLAYMELFFTAGVLCTTYHSIQYIYTIYILPCRYISLNSCSLAFLVLRNRKFGMVKITLRSWPRVKFKTTSYQADVNRKLKLLTPDANYDQHNLVQNVRVTSDGRFICVKVALSKRPLSICVMPFASRVFLCLSSLL